MATILCPNCKRNTSIALTDYDGTVQCETCAKFLEVVVRNHIVTEVRIKTEPGPDILGLPSDVNEAYAEARRCMEVKAYTAAELICRKILMHIAVDKGATEGEPFASYLSFLEQKGYITPPMRDWVHLIREHGNEAAHMLPCPDEHRANSTFFCTVELLRLVYEMGFIAKRFAKSSKKER